MDNQLKLFLDSSVAYDLAIDFVEVNGVDVEIQEKQIEEPCADKDHCLYSANFSELVVLTVSFTNLAISLTSFATLIINSKFAQVENQSQSSNTSTHKQSIEVGDKTILLSSFSNTQALIDFVQEEFRYQQRLYENQVASLEKVASRPINIVNKAENNSMSKTFNNNFQKPRIANFANQLDGNARQQANQYNYTPEQKQTLAEAAAEIQSLLSQLEQNNPNASEAEQKAFVNAAIPQTRKERFLNALQAGGKEALKEFLDNPYLNVAIAVIEGWKE
jgi:hypothetical protein